MKKKVKLLAVILLLAVSAALAAAFIIYNNSRNHKAIKVSGTIEGDDVRISFRVDGQITDLLTDEGMVIKKDDIVARLNKDELSKIQAQADAALKLAQYQYKLDYDDYQRAENLLKAGAISVQQRDAAKTKAETDKANIDQLRASLELANTKLGWTDLASPLNGYVLVKSALPGEVVQSGAPVFTAIDLNNIWVTAYVNETDLGKVKLGQKAYVETDSYKGKKYDGWVSFLSDQAEFTPKYIQTTEERVKYVYRVKVRVDNSSLELKPGMPADAYIILK
ncbi:MAG: efflux RND transporter periplasmic adaptor subunit [Candidatus Omnitrophica bacterium]|nr:efflux RND transporter periplasmic adaptor subunit [Candidatus Omnitrophota bacterium]MDD5652866.1 efflux RND transporter periplasmic adaptor subunit [Candidatus Omnitrophota bacterium]